MRTFLKKLHHILPTSRMTQLVVFLAFCSRCFCFHKRNLFAHYYYIKETKSEPHPLYKLHNFRNTSSEAFRLVKFIQARKLNPRGRNLDFFSVYGSKKAFQYSSHPKIFFNGEPTTHQGKYRFQEYGDYCLDLVDLALGFKNLNAENALRFPLYLMFFIQPEMSDREISALCSTINQRDLIISQQRKKFATLIARHNDPQQIRSKTFKKLHKIGRIDCPGMLFHNLDETIGENDKISFLQQYRFNICPENTLEKGYVTEKLVDAIQGGCVPIYRGMLDEWDKQIFNKEAIIYIGDNLIDRVKTLCEDKQYYAFLEIPPLQKHASEWIISLLEHLERKIQRMLG